MLPPLELKVYPNPWGLHPNHLDDGSVTPTSDHEGRPAGAVFFERHYAGTGLSARTTVLATEPRPRGDFRSRRQRTIMSYLGIDADVDDLGTQLATKEPVSLPVDQEYVAAVRKGLLIAADDGTARYCGVTFKAPKELLPEMEQAFDKARDRQYGEGASKQLHERRKHFAKAKEPAKQDEKPAPKATGKKDGN
jgi:hypothetical protein